MQFLTHLIGVPDNDYLTAALALGIVVILILLGLWALKMIQGSGNIGRGSRRRLAVVDSLPVDNKRQLVIIRRDNVEHLILTGGPQDVVVETGFSPEIQNVAPRPVPTPQRGPSRPAPVAPPVASPTPQRTPVPQRAQGPEPALPQASNDHNPVRDSLERLREFPRPAGPRRPSLLRHTGLMRPVGRTEPPLAPANSDNSARPNPDSATTGRVTPFGGPQNGNGQGFGRDGSPGEQRDEGF